MTQREERALGECVRRSDDILSESRWNASVRATSRTPKLQNHGNGSLPQLRLRDGKGFLWSKCVYLGMTHQ